MGLKTWKDAIKYTLTITKCKTLLEQGNDPCGFCSVFNYLRKLGKLPGANCSIFCPITPRDDDCLDFWERVSLSRRRKIGEYVLANVKVFSARNIRAAIIQSGVLTDAELRVFNGEGE